MEYISKILPHWLDEYLLHGNDDIFDDGEKECLDKFIADNKLGECVDQQAPDDPDAIHELDFSVFPEEYGVSKFIFKTLE